MELLGDRARTISEIADELDVHHSTALRLLHTLRRQGFVHLQEDGRYRLGSATFRLANQALERLDVRDLARPNMEQLSQVSGETVHLGLLEGKRVVYIEKVEARHPVRMYSRIGAIAPLHCTGLAKALLMCLEPKQLANVLEGHDFRPLTDRTHRSVEDLMADLDRSAARGFARDDEEHEAGIHCIAAPVLNADGKPAAAISISAPISRVPRASLLEQVQPLRDAARDVSRKLGWEAAAATVAPLKG